MIGILTEEDRIFFNRYDELSYTKKDSMVELYVNDFCIGHMKVWVDSEMNGREYLTINDEIIYLDTIAKNH